MTEEKYNSLKAFYNSAQSMLLRSKKEVKETNSKLLKAQNSLTKKKEELNRAKRTIDDLSKQVRKLRRLTIDEGGNRIAVSPIESEFFSSSFKIN